MLKYFVWNVYHANPYSILQPSAPPPQFTYKHLKRQYNLNRYVTSSIFSVMSDRESKAAENYQAFDQLRNRFGGAKKPQPFHKKDRPLRRRDSRLEAPPLKPLVEEGDSPSDAHIPSVPLPPSQGSQNGSHLVRIYPLSE